MANEISFAELSGNTFYAIIKTATGEFISGTTPEIYDYENWLNYVIPIYEYPESNGQYHGDFPPLAPGIYRIEIYKQVGPEPSLTDEPPISEGQIYWSGTSEVFQSTIDIAALLQALQPEIETIINASLNKFKCDLLRELHHMKIQPERVILRPLD